MAEKNVNEKDEKQLDEKDEKELLKHDEKVEERDTLSSIVWAAILIWAGLVFLAVNSGWLDKVLAAGFIAKYLPKGMEVFEPAAWGIIMLGAGVILLSEAVIRLVVPQFHKHLGGTLIVAAIFIAVGLGNFLGNWEFIWPFILIAAGVSVLVSGLGRKRQ
ncbi:MAG: hypothetical protein Q8N39_12270 [Pelolinea sp.]|nr:hypothetical protein [Pelolinea sp.]